MHTYQMGDGCEGGVLLKRDRSSITEQEHAKEEQRRGRERERLRWLSWC